MQFGVEDTLNRSMGTASPTTFDAGGFKYDQLVLNFSAVKAYDVEWLESPLNVATGLEAREEGYQIFAGEPASYINGGVLLPSGAPTASGAQVFPGFRPANVTDADRTAVGAYVDLEANLTEKFLGSVAVRAEDYSDFGSNVSEKVAARYDFTDAFALRASAQTGFRAPSLQQQYFATTSTNFIAGIPYDITVVPGQRSDRACSRRAGPRRRRGDELFIGRGHELRGGDADGRHVPHRHRQPHRALREPHARQRARISREPGFMASAAAASSSTASTPRRAASTSC
jgi:hypothetical protein